MSRPTYETEANRAAQYAVAAELGAAWGCTLRDLPHSYRIDYCATRSERIVAMVEVKCRSHCFNDHPDVMISLGKWKVLKEYEAIGIPGIMAFRFGNGEIWYHRVKDFTGSPLWGGRSGQARDKDDCEPVVHIENKFWRKL